MNRLSLGMALIAVTGVVAGSAAAEDWGNLTGKFVYKGKAPTPAPLKIDKDPTCCKVKHVDESLVVGQDGGLANVFVYVRTPKVKVHPSYDEAAKSQVVLDNKTCQFQPHAMGLRVGQTLVIKDSDDCSHNTNISPLGGGGTNPLIPAGGSVDYKFPKQQNIPVPVACNIHPWMKAYVLPRDNPYVAVSGPDGSFKIENLPAGELEFQVWQEKAGFVEAPGWTKGKFKKAIKAGENDLGTIELDAKLFKK